MTDRLVVAILILLGVAETPALAQRQQRDAGIPLSFSPADWAAKNPIQNQFYRLPGISSDYRIGPGDQLEVFISDYSARSVPVTVSNSGEITIPLVGSLSAADVTAAELEDRIVALLVAKNLIRTPEVLVHVAEHVARPIYVIGEVDNPGQYMMSQQLTLMEAIFLAGGLDFTAGRYGYLHRRIAGGAMRPPSRAVLDRAEVALPGHTVTRFDLQPLKEGGVLESDVPLRAGDVVAIPRRLVEVFYVIGDVVKSGAFEIPAQRSIKVTQALAYSGGPTGQADKSAGVLVRIEADGQRRELPVDFAAILQGKKPDLDVKPNDVIFVPGAGVKNFATGVLGVVPAILQAALIFY